MGVPYTSDPWKMIRNSYLMMDHGRHVAATLFLSDALQRFEAKGDEIGMAEVHHAFGNLYKNTQTIKVPPDFDKSIAHFTQAKNLFESNSNYMGVAKSLAGIANALALKQQSVAACTYYDQSLEAYREGKARDPSATIPILTGWKDFPTLIEAFKEQEGCRKGKSVPEIRTGYQRDR